MFDVERLAASELDVQFHWASFCLLGWEVGLDADRSAIGSPRVEVARSVVETPHLSRASLLRPGFSWCAVRGVNTDMESVLPTALWAWCFRHPSPLRERVRT